MISTNDMRPGQTLDIEGTLFNITYYQHVKPGKGQAFVKTKLKNVKTGAVIDRTFRADEKVNLALAFLFSPGILVLDEPTAGLDPVSSGVVKEKILRERGKGRTFVLTSHVMTELEELADDIAFLVDGRIRFSGAVKLLKRITRQLSLERAIAQIMEGGLAA